LTLALVLHPPSLRLRRDQPGIAHSPSGSATRTDTVPGSLANPGMATRPATRRPSDTTPDRQPPSHRPFPRADTRKPGNAPAALAEASGAHPVHLPNPFYRSRGSTLSPRCRTDFAGYQ